ncbi:hypothetical protein [Nitrospirillum sp. BR 11163]|uniref:hypothetical protein n=1 Tax=Nitrospirillum sp. BR 11163 TaxID=3104323 RepID=UPI002AFDD93F|nr:hypothetical protein [Nitrospirillum sp. BR 11163]MEA1674124.1 hypothetical protein [Nitrospirillum sp. BR 11163]
MARTPKGEAPMSAAERTRAKEQRRAAAGLREIRVIVPNEDDAIQQVRGLAAALVKARDDANQN